VKKYNTIIFVPHARARFRKITVSNRFLAAAVSSVAILLVASIAFGWAFLASARRDREYRKTQAENARLQSTAASLQQRLTQLSRTLDEFDSKTRRLSIVAGLTPPTASGVGGPTTSGGAPGSESGRTGEIADRLARIETQLTARASIMSSTPTVQPVRGVYNSGFGDRQDPFTGTSGFHQGVDIATNRGEPVEATAEGTVEKAEWSGDLGNMVELSHPTGYRTIYGHLEKSLVKAGQHVRRGEVIGLVGSTGRATGPHLHYEVRRGDRAVNPLEYILDAR
jgi:murein DD-endopeptidase MepM/ murein hydrolase activator NlpD